ncbi:MAG: hypothetical protein ACMUHY_04905, partial [Thermoplasmatota archaeon]
MKTWLKVVLISIGVFFLVLSAIWFLAWSSSGYPSSILIQFIFMIVMGIIPIAVVVILSRFEKAPQVNIDQRIEIRSDDLVGGDKTYEKLAQVAKRHAGVDLAYLGEIGEDPNVSRRRLGQPPVVTC